MTKDDEILAELLKLRAEVAEFNRLRQEAQTEARLLRAEAERLRADNEALQTAVAAERDHLTEEALADAQARLSALAAEVERLRAENEEWSTMLGRVRLAMAAAGHSRPILPAHVEDAALAGLRLRARAGEPK
jgi:chromosome segregation ATPase